MTNFSLTWLDALRDIIDNGDVVSPRGELTKEIQQRTIKVDTRRPVLRVPRRKLNYRFMAAEAFWILSGDDTVQGISKYNPNIAQFSDDGIKFFGSYGPKIISQLEYVLNKLDQDNDTRQAGLTIWRECPEKTKDVPCTVSIFFNIRNGKLNSNVFMRSNDVWLGMPYDVFNFSMLVHLVCAHLNKRNENTVIQPGNLFLTAASSHLYDRNIETAIQCLNDGACLEQPDTPNELWQDPEHLMAILKDLRDTSPSDPLRWWE